MAKILYIDEPMQNNIAATSNKSSFNHNCHVADETIMDNLFKLINESPERQASSYFAAGRFFCMASIDDVTQERAMIIVELGKTDEDLYRLLDFMSKKDSKAPSEHRQAAIMCFKNEFEPNYDKHYYDFEVKVGSPS